MKAATGSGLNARLFAITIVALLVASLAVSVIALRLFERNLVPELESKAQTIGRSVLAPIEKALGYRIPYEKLRGVDDLFAAAMRDNGELRYIAATDRQGKILYSYGNLPENWREGTVRAGSGGALAGAAYYDTQLPVRGPDGVAGFLHVGVDRAFISRALESMFFDVFIVFIVSVLIAFELLLFLITTSVSGPVHTLHGFFARVDQGGGRRAPLSWLWGKFSNAYFGAMHPPVATDGDGRSLSPASPRRSLVFIRTPLFLFAIAEELSRPFLPVYMRDLYRPVPGLSEEAVLGLPIAVFMAVVALIQPPAGYWSERVGRRTTFITGAALSCIGLAMTGFAGDLYQLLLWRIMVAAGYGIVFVACQGYVIDNTDTRSRAQGMAIFVGGIMAAAIAGPAIGGVLADRIGFRATFIVGAGLALLSVLFVLQFLGPDRHREHSVRRITWADALGVLGNFRFLALVVFGAIPAKMILTGFLFYLAPLYLTLLDSSQSEIGRVMMVYGIAMIVLSPLAARLADLYGHRVLFVALGGLISGLAMAGILREENFWMILWAVVGLGIGQSVSIAPQLALVSEVCAAECQRIGQGTVFGVFRLLERMGAALGPFAVAAMLKQWGYAWAMAGIGSIVAMAGILLALVFAFFPARTGREVQK